MRVVGVGNAWRGDDAAGLVTATLVREALPGVDVRECEGEPVQLLDAWEGADAVWLVDAVSSGARPGTVHRFDAEPDELPRDLFRASTHALGVADAVELARTLGRLPPRLVVFGIEGARFSAGEGLTPEVAAAAAQTASLVQGEVEECTSRR